MNSALRRASVRYLIMHPWQVGLSVLGIALGVAMALGIDLATGSARRAFELSTEALTGRATHQIVGGPSGVPDALYARLRLELGVSRAAPVVEADVAAAAHPGRTFRLFGTDPFADAAFRPDLGVAAGGGTSLDTLAALITRPGAALLSAPTARELRLAPGDALVIGAGSRRVALTVVGVVEPADRLSARALDSLVLTDIATAQEALGAGGRLSRVDLIVADDAGGRALLDRIRSALPPGAEIVPAGARESALASMTQAFSLNLTALSLLALIVGMFLIGNAMTFSVVQRRPLIGTLRALGVTRGEVFGIVVVEALLVGALGTALGVGLGIVLARGLLGLVTQTVNDLYFVVSVREVAVTPWALGRSAALGLGATVLAALGPALEATGARPREALYRSRLEARTRRAIPRAAAAAVVVAAAGAVGLAWPSRGPLPGLAGLFAVLMAAALAAPAATLLALRVLVPLAGLVAGPLGRMAARGIGAALSRTGIAIAALMIAVSATMGVGVMIASFREAVARWLETTLRADVYVSAPSLLGNRPDATLDERAIERLIATPGVAGWSTSRAVPVPGPAGPVQLVAIRLDAGRAPGFTLTAGRADLAWPAVEAGAVLVSEPYAYRHGVAAGGRVRLVTDRGPREFPVAGVFYDYGASGGAVVMSRTTYDRFWDDPGVTALALYAAAGLDTGTLVGRLRARAAEGPAVVIRANRDLREASLEVFDRTFRITGVLRLMIVGVAFVGVLSALMALELERIRETGLLRALGLTPRQVWAMVTAQTGLIGALAGLFAVPLGLLLAAILVHVINRRSFGWTMPLLAAPGVLLQGVALAIGAALLAGLYPARRMARASPAEALRDE